jgi:predicted phosphodiesterase
MMQLFENHKRIGLMADSHGHKTIMSTCINRLQACNVDLIVHLGDFFDSQCFEDAMDILEMIQQNKILLVKGNNDYQFEKSLMNSCPHHISAIHREQILSFLASIPMKFVANNICFTHSLPFDSIRSFYEPIDTGKTDRAESIFQHTPYHVVFSGHSHSSILFRLRSHQVTRESMKVSKPITLYQNERFIVVVGSADDGECGFFDIFQMQYEKIKL